MQKKQRNKNNKQTNNTVKKGGGILLILAALILVANAILSQRGTALPEELTDFAEDVVAESLEQAPDTVSNSQSETDSSSNETTQTQNKRPTPTPKPLGTPTPGRVETTIANEAVPWAEANGNFDYYVLALSWQPAFCEGRPDKSECRTQTQNRFDANNFVLHGLWPNQRMTLSISLAIAMSRLNLLPKIKTATGVPYLP